MMRNGNPGESQTGGHRVLRPTQLRPVPETPQPPSTSELQRNPSTSALESKPLISPQQRKAMAQASVAGNRGDTERAFRLLAKPPDTPALPNTGPSRTQALGLRATPLNPTEYEDLPEVRNINYGNVNRPSQQSELSPLPQDTDNLSLTPLPPVRTRTDQLTTMEQLAAEMNMIYRGAELIDTMRQGIPEQMQSQIYDTRDRFGRFRILAPYRGEDYRQAFRTVVENARAEKRQRLANPNASLTPREIGRLREQVIRKAQDIAIDRRREARKQKKQIKAAAEQHALDYLNNQIITTGEKPSRGAVRAEKKRMREKLEDAAAEDKRKKQEAANAPKNSEPIRKAEPVQNPTEAERAAKELVITERRREALITSTGADNELYRANWDRIFNQLTADKTKPLTVALLRQINRDAVRITDKTIEDVRREVEQNARASLKFNQELLQLSLTEVPDEATLQLVERNALDKAKASLPKEQQEEELLRARAKAEGSSKNATQPLPEVQQATTEQKPPTPAEIQKVLDTEEGRKFLEASNERVNQLPEGPLRQKQGLLEQSLLIAFILAKRAAENTTE